MSRHSDTARRTGPIRRTGTYCLHTKQAVYNLILPDTRPPCRSSSVLRWRTPWFNRHVGYIYYNPVEHGLRQRAVEWPHSTFHRYVAQGVYSADWGGVETGSEVGTLGE
jgi:hypothetical protein